MIDKPKLLIMLFIVFLISGLVVGFLMGGYTTQEKWITYTELKEKEIERYCSCDYPKELEFNLNLSLIYENMR